MISPIILSELKRGLRALFLVVFLVSVFSTPNSAQAAAAGFSEYYIPGSVSQLMSILDDIETSNIGTSLTNVVTVSVGADNVTIYYDHWENGYGNGSTGNDEVYVANKGDVLTFRSNVAIAHGAVLDDCSGSIFPSGGSPAGAATRCYDGRDRIYVAGGAVSVAQAFWPVTSNTNYANAWEVYPIKPYQTTYTIPVGENLYAPNSSFADFLNVYVIVQATANGTHVEINDPGSVGVEIIADLNRGQTTELFHIDAGTTVTASAPVQVQFIVGEDVVIPAQNNSRGYTAVPSSLWSSEYYSAVPGFAGGWDTDLFIYNPTASPLTINYQDSLGSGSFSVAANSAESYQANVGRYVPVNSAVYLAAADGVTKFWAIGSVDAGSPTFNWGFALLPPNELTSEYFISWAPGGWNQGNPGAAVQSNYSPLYVTPVNDNTTIFVDNSPADGIVDQTFTLDRIEMQRIFDTFDADNTGLHIWATGPIAIVWGEDPNTSPQASPGLDAGYTILPLNQEWIDIVLTMDKSANPDVIPAEVGAISTFTLVTKTDQFGLQDVSIVDALPAGWGYVAGNTVITLPDEITTIRGASADPDIAGQQLTWNDFPVGPLDMNGNETLTIQFQAQTTSVPTQDFYINEATATGTSGTETFSASDTATVEVTSLAIQKVSSAGGTVTPGGTITYTVNITNNGGTAQNNVVVNDPLPAGTTYVAASTTVNGFTFQPQTVGDAFNAIAFNGNQDGNGATDPSWSGNWAELGENNGANAGNLQVLTDLGNNYVLRIQNANRGVARTVDLSSCASATLSLNYRRNALDGASDYARLSIGTGGTATNTLNDFAGPTNDAAYQSYNVDISPWIDAQTRVQLQASGTLGGGDNIYFDNILITCQLPLALIKDNIVAGFNADLINGTPPTLVFAGDNFDLAPGATMTVTYQVTVNNPVPSGQTSVVNTVSVTSDEQSTPLRATVTDLLPPPGAISGTVWADTNNDNVGDTPIAGVTIELLDGQGNVIATTNTDANGNYSFTNVAPGDYRIRETQPAGYTSVSDIDGGDLDLIGDVTPVTVLSGQTNSGNDFVEEQPGAITGTVLADTNNDNTGDAPIAGVTLELLDASGNPMDSDPNTPGVQPTTTTTDANGNYSFTNVPPGDYQVRETQPAGYDSVSDKDGGNLDLIGDQTIITVTAGATNTGNDFVEEQLGSISGQVRYDGDNDGDPTDTDSAIVGVTIELYENGVLIATTNTDSSGNYTFPNLPPGNYVVVEVNPTGYTSTYDLDGTLSNTLDQIAVALAAGQNSAGNDFLDTSVPHIDVEKNPPTQTVASGSNVNFTITVTNDGSIDLDPVVVTDAQCDVLTRTNDGNGNTALEVNETWTYTCTVNNVTVDFINTVSAVGTPSIGPDVSDTDTAQVDVLPTISVTKDASVASVPETGGSVTFTYTVTNTGTVNVNITSLSDDQFGALTGDADCQIGTLLAPAASCSFDFTTNLTGTVGVPHVNVFTATAEDADGNPASDDDDATVNFTAIPGGVNKTLTATSNDYTDGSDVAIGEILTYQVTINVPQGDFADFQLVDEMERGLAFVECVSINAPGLTTDVPDSFAAVCANPTTDAAGLPMDVDRIVRFNFGTLSNNGQSDATLTITYRAIVLDIATNLNGTALNNSAQFTWTGGETNPVQTEVSIVEPELHIEKTSDVNFIANGSEVTFTLTVSHTNASSADAFDVVVTDVLPTGLDFVPGSLDCALGAQDPDVECVFDNSNPAQPTIRAEWSVFARNGGEGQIRFRVVGNANIPADGNVTNTANAEWSSMPGDQTTPISFSKPANQFATERYYDPTDLINLYGDSSALTLTRLGGGGGGGGRNNNNPPSSPAVTTGFLIPVTGFAPDRVTELNIATRPSYGQTGLTMEIPVINVKTGIVGVDLKNGNWDVSWLQDQAGWLDGTAYPTWTGNSVLTAHSVNKDGRAGVFSKLKTLKTGEYIFVYNNGYRYTYKVVSNTTVKPNDISVLTHEEKSYLTLITCDNYDEKSSAYLNRIAVRALLVDVRRVK